MDNKKSALLMAIGIMAAALLSACTVGGRSFRIGDLQEESRSVEMLDAEQVDVRIELGVGELIVGGGAAELMEADFAYNVEALAPDIDVSDDRLSILTPEANIRSTSFFDLDEFRNEWDLSFSDDVSMTMDIDLGVGEAELDLGSLDLERLDIDAGVGALDLDLSGSPIEVLNLDAGVGDVRIDLSGVTTQHLEVDIDSGVGEITIILPRDVGVHVDVHGGITDVDAEGFVMRSGGYANVALGDDDAVIEVRIDAGVGEINLELEK